MAKSRSYTSTPRTRKSALTTFGSRTDIGCVRDHNEDSLIVAPPLFVVADGMGGHAAGEVASEIAVSVLEQQAPAHPDSEQLERAVEEANREVILAQHDGRGREGMGTTVTAAMLEGERLVIAQVGDSRAYLLHHGRLQQLTRDHSLMADMIEAGQLTPEEARFHPNRSVITRALGSDPLMRPDIFEINVEAGDRLLICSDGLSGMLRDPEIETTLRRVHDPQRCASQLVNEAIAAGGHDNVTVIVADVVGHSHKKLKRVKLKARLTVFFILLLFAAIIAGAAWGGYAYLNSRAYLSAVDGKVAIYTGVPGSVMGISFSELDRVTDVSVDDLQPGTAYRLEAGIQVDNLQAAESLVREYESEAAARQAEQADDEAAMDDAANDGETADGEGATAPDTTAATAPTETGATA